MSGAILGRKPPWEAAMGSRPISLIRSQRMWMRWLDYEREHTVSPLGSQLMWCPLFASQLIRCLGSV